MKHKFHLLALLTGLTGLVGCGPDTYVITGKLDPATTDSVYLLALPGRTPIAATVPDEAGLFRIEGQIHQPEVALLTSGGRDLTLLFPEAGEISALPDGHGRLRPGGTPMNNRFAALNDTLSALRTEYYALGPEADAAELDTLQAAFDRLYDDAIRLNSDNMLGAYLLAERADKGDDLPNIEEHLLRFPEELRQTPQLQAVQARLERAARTAIGAPCPALTLPDAAGREIALASLTNSGRWVLVTFWATWSLPSRLELEHLHTLYDTRLRERLAIYSVSLDNDTAAWRRYLSQESFDWTDVRAVDGGVCSLADRLELRELPTNLLINPEGRIAARDLHGKSLDDRLSELRE